MSPDSGLEFSSAESHAMLPPRIIPSSLAPSSFPTSDGHPHQQLCPRVQKGPAVYVLSLLLASGPNDLPELTCSLDPARSHLGFFFPSGASGPTPQAFSSNTIAKISMATALLKLVMPPSVHPRPPGHWLSNPNFQRSLFRMQVPGPWQFSYTGPMTLMLKQPKKPLH